jgi:hypothetical protein
MMMKRNLIYGFVLAMTLTLMSQDGFAALTVTYVPDFSQYSNIDAWHYTDGFGNAYGYKGIDYWDEIGVMQIIESLLVVKVEVYGSGCYLPVTLTCNGITQSATFSHDVPPFGTETLTFDISPSNVVSLYSSVHEWPIGVGENRGFQA